MVLPRRRTASSGDSVSSLAQAQNGGSSPGPRRWTRDRTRPRSRHARPVPEHPLQLGAELLERRHGPGRPAPLLEHRRQRDRERGRLGVQRPGLAAVVRVRILGELDVRAGAIAEGSAHDNAARVYRKPLGTAMLLAAKCCSSHS